MTFKVGDIFFVNIPDYEQYTMDGVCNGDYGMVSDIDEDEDEGDVYTSIIRSDGTVCKGFIIDKTHMVAVSDDAALMMLLSLTREGEKKYTVEQLLENIRNRNKD